MTTAARKARATSGAGLRDFYGWDGLTACSVVARMVGDSGPHGAGLWGPSLAGETVGETAGETADEMADQMADKTVGETAAMMAGTTDGSMVWTKVVVKIGATERLRTWRSATSRVELALH